MRTIKTREDFDNVLHSWYNRTVKLRMIAEDSNESIKRVQKATFLYREMIPRTLALIVKDMELNPPKVCDFKSGTKKRKPHAL